jgi:hypothetical protein
VTDFIDELAKDFPKAGTREELAALVDQCSYVAAGRAWLRPGEDWWGALAAATDKVTQLCREHRAELVGRLSQHREFGGAAASRVDATMAALAVIGRPTLNRHDEGAGRKGYNTTRAMLSVIVGHWVLRVGRFTDNRSWVGGEPMTLATRFAYAIIEHVTPGRGREIKSMAREFSKTP